MTLCNMRTEQEMLELILSIAKSDERIRAVIMNGSRANPNAPKDIFQDFDIVYVVTDVTPFRNNPLWAKQFGETIIMQMPEAMQDPPPVGNGAFAYLMQFSDGNRIDLTIITHELMGNDSLSILLLDKDNRIEPFVSPSEKDYLPTPPTAKLFDDCCNEFFWVSTYVAKGLWRQEIIYAKDMQEVMRIQLIKMLEWHIGINTQFSKNSGKSGKYFKQYLEPELWNMLLETYADADYSKAWDSLFKTCELFRKVSLSVSEHFGFEYGLMEDEWVVAYLQHVRLLPRNATKVY
jgi:aminoglycoside 6-adenylyltransferase